MKMILKDGNTQECITAQIDLCLAAYRYVGKILDTFTEDCILVVLNKSIPKDVYHRALMQLVTFGMVIPVGNDTDGTLRYKFAQQ